MTKTGQHWPTLTCTGLNWPTMMYFFHSKKKMFGNKLNEIFLFSEDLLVFFKSCCKEK